MAASSGGRDLLGSFGLLCSSPSDMRPKSPKGPKRPEKDKAFPQAASSLSLRSDKSQSPDSPASPDFLLGNQSGEDSYTLDPGSHSKDSDSFNNSAMAKEKKIEDMGIDLDCDFPMTFLTSGQDPADARQNSKGEAKDVGEEEPQKSNSAECHQQEWYGILTLAQERMKHLVMTVKEQEVELAKLRTSLVKIASGGHEIMVPAGSHAASALAPAGSEKRTERRVLFADAPESSAGHGKGEEGGVMVQRRSSKRSNDGSAGVEEALSLQTVPPKREAWVATKKKLRHQGSTGNLLSDVGGLSSRESTRPKIKADREPLYGEETKGRFSNFVLSPNSPKKMCWDVFCTFIIGYDVLMLPLVAFGKDDWEFVHIISYITVGFWTMDMGINFFSGYHCQDGAIEMSLVKTVLHYLKTWFPLDVSVLSLDWFLVFATAHSEAASMGRANKFARFVRVLKVLRFVRLARVAKLAHLYEEICEYAMTPATVTFMSILRLLIGLALFVHYVACGWYAVGMGQYEEGEESWISPWKSIGSRQSYLYVISYHWTMAQFLPAPCPDHPKNFEERLFTVGVLFAGFLVFSSTMGSVTALITQSKKTAWEKMRYNNTLRRFYMDNKVSHDLATRITHSLAQQKTRAQAFVLESDVEMLSSMPALLKVEIHYEMHRSTLENNPFLSRLHDWSTTVMREICNEAVIEKSLQKSDVPFHQFDKGVSVRFVKYGTLRYYPFLQEEVEGWQLLKDIGQGDYISEACLWVQWTHQGFCCATETSRVIELKAEAFGTCIGKVPRLQHRALEYADLFHTRMVEKYGADPDGADDLFKAFNSAEYLRDVLFD